MTATRWLMGLLMVAGFVGAIVVVFQLPPLAGIATSVLVAFGYVSLIDPPT